MSRILKKVPLNFSWPIGEIWAGYKNPFYWCAAVGEEIQEKYGEAFKKIEPPKGKGFQLWENTSEGSPISPVFKTLDALCEWAEENATTFGRFKTSKEDWKKMLSDNFVFHKEGNNIFM